MPLKESLTAVCQESQADCIIPTVALSKTNKPDKGEISRRIYPTAGHVHLKEVTAAVIMYM